MARKAYFFFIFCKLFYVIGLDPVSQSLRYITENHLGYISTYDEFSERSSILSKPFRQFKIL